MGKKMYLANLTRNKLLVGQRFEEVDSVLVRGSRARAVDHCWSGDSPF